MLVVAPAPKRSFLVDRTGMTAHRSRLIPVRAVTGLGMLRSVLLRRPGSALVAPPTPNLVTFERTGEAQTQGDTLYFFEPFHRDRFGAIAAGAIAQLS